MKNLTRGRVVLGLTFSIVSVIAAAAWAHSSGLLANPTAVAVVDMDALQSGMDELRALEAILDERNAGYLEDISQMETQLDALALRLQEEGPSMKDDERSQLTADGMRLSSRIENDKQIVSNLFQFNAHLLMSEVYPKIYAAIGAIAERDGWDIVLLDTSRIDAAGQQDFSAMNAAVARRSVLFVDPKVDITADVITLLNNDLKIVPNAEPEE